jgi:hypothetical protein
VPAKYTLEGVEIIYRNLLRLGVVIFCTHTLASSVLRGRLFHQTDDATFAR